LSRNQHCLDSASPNRRPGRRIGFPGPSIDKAGDDDFDQPQ